MKVEQFFEKFELIAHAPNAVQKMRELVLRLATSGRITEQADTDQPGSELLNEIFAVREKLIKRGAVKSRTEGTPIAAGDTIEIPSSWARCMIAEVCDLQTGATPSRMENSYFGGDIRWLVSGDINKGEITECDGRITTEGLENSNCKIIPANSVLIALNGQGKTRATVAVLRIPAALNQSLVAMIPYSVDLLLPEYIFWNLRGRYHAIRDITGQDQRRGLNMKLVGQLSLPIPPLAEQKRIVARVNELMALCDQLESQQQEREAKKADLARAALARFSEAPTPANLEFIFHKSYDITPADLRNSILTLAVQGKLVPQDPNDDEPEIALLELHCARIRQAKAGKLRAAKVPASAFLEEPSTLTPNSWRTVSFDHLAVPHNNALKAGPFGSALKKEFYVERGYKIYGQEQVIAGDPFIGDYYIDEKKFAELESCAVSPGDILISLVGTIGKILVLPEGIEPGIINPRVIKLSLDASLVYPFFIRILIASPYAVDFFGENSHGGTMSILNLSILRALPIPLPPLAEQRRIVAKVEQLMALVDDLEVQLRESKTISSKLLEAVSAALAA